MNRLVLSVSLLGLAACDVVDLRPMLATVTAPEALVPSSAVAAPILTAKERLVLAIEGQGCELNKDNVGVILSDATISADELQSIIPQLQAEGRVAVKDTGAIRVNSSNCI